jgi:plastocyanin
MTPHRIAVAAAAGALTLTLAACNGETDNEVDAAPGDAEVEMLDNSFSPEDVEVAAGDAILWTNEGQAPHTVTFDDGPDSGQVAPGDTFEHSFDEAGEYPYVCTFHPGMEGTVTVTD